MQTKLKIVCLGLVATIVCAAVLAGAPLTAFAMEESQDENIDNIANYENVEPLALFVDVVLAIGGENGEVYSAAQTQIAIFATTIYVVLELYSSDTYQEAYTNMTLEKRVASNNLKKGEIIKASVPTNGVQKYWRGRMYYRADSGNWKFGETDTVLFDANGIVVL